MKYKTYTKMRDSKIENLNKIPEHWEVKKIKDIGKFIGGFAFDSRDYVDNGVTLLRISNVSHGKIIWDEIAYLPDSFWSFFPDAQVKKYDLLMAMTRPVIDTGLKVSFFTEDSKCLLNQRVGKFVLGTNILPKYLYYFLNQRLIVDQIDFRTSETLQPNISSHDVENIDFWHPLLSEQKQISDYLDSKTKQIDSEIQKCQKLVTFLQEKRQSMINQAVTKGLDPSVPMKDSGMEWIGEMPEHWEIQKIKHQTDRITLGIVVEPSKYFTEEGVPFLRGVDIEEGRINTSDLRFMSPESNIKNSKSILHEGDLVTIRVGYPGITAVIPKKLHNSNCASLMIIGKSQKFNSNFLCYTMNSSIGKLQFQQITIGAAQTQFSIFDAQSLRFPFPSTIEQKQIADFLDKQTSKIDSLISKSEAQIERLQEFKQSLISAAVTGKIDVRNTMTA